MLQVRQLRDGRYRLTLWHHIQPCPDDEQQYDLILERSIPVIVLGETFATKTRAELVTICVENSLLA